MALVAGYRPVVYLQMVTRLRTNWAERTASLLKQPTPPGSGQTVTSRLGWPENVQCIKQWADLVRAKPATSDIQVQYSTTQAERYFQRR